MADVSIAEAVALFAGSNTASGGQGQVARWPQRVVERLRYLNDIEEIGFVLPAAKQKRETNRGSWKEGRSGYDLRVNPEYLKRLPEKDRLAAVSVVLVHEGMHAVLGDSIPRLNEELLARKVPIYYYRELIRQGVVNSWTGQRVWLGASDGVDHLRAQSRYVDQDQLVDHTLAVRSYHKLLEPAWIKDTKDLWGGLANRWPGTRRLYVKTLLSVAADPYFGSLVLEILESIQSRQEWDAMIDSIKQISGGSLRSVQIKLDGLLGDRNLRARLGRLEQKWKVGLTESPPTAGRR
jgi:hypothetical protein